MDPQELLRRIESYLAENRDLTECQFGRTILGDPNFVKDLRDGRECRWSTVQRVLAAIGSKGSEPEQPAAGDNPFGTSQFVPVKANVA